MTDHELIEGIRSCDPRVADYLIATYWEPLLRYADGILEGAADAQDVVQNVFLRLWSHRERWGAVGSVRALLYTVTRNAALDERRRLTREASIHPDSVIPRGGPSPSDEAVSEEIRRAAAEAVSSLPPRRQEVFRLVREQGLSYREVAAVMGISAQTVANQMSRAMAELRQALEPHLDEATRGRREEE